jgi:hypothetical protein
MIEFLVILLVIAYMYYEPKLVKKKIHDPWGFWKGEE